jgi:predicted nucleic acid-binding protein
MSSTSAEPTREFVDANILVYALDPSAASKHNIAKDLVRRLWASEAGCLSVQVLQEFFVTVTRKVARPLPIEEAEDRVREFAAWHVFTPVTDDVLAAIALHKKSKLSFWDAMIVHAAAESGCSVCWTEDLNVGQRLRGVLIQNPFLAPSAPDAGSRT